MEVYVYGLWDNETGLVHYIGQTSSPERRYPEHLAGSNPSLADWLKSLRERCDYPRWMVLETCDESNCDETERQQIQFHREAGHPLLNSGRRAVGPRRSLQTHCRNGHKRSPSDIRASRACSACITKNRRRIAAREWLLHRELRHLRSPGPGESVPLADEDYAIYVVTDDAVDVSVLPDFHEWTDARQALSSDGYFQCLFVSPGLTTACACQQDYFSLELIDKADEFQRLVESRKLRETEAAFRDFIKWGWREPQPEDYAGW